MSIAATHAGPFTIDDLDRFPDDGHRYELIEGTLIVTAAPSVLHQFMCARLYDVLHAASPPGLRALPGPAGVHAGPATVFQPDVLVVRVADIRAAPRQAPLPLLVVEVASPSTRLVDQGTKRLAYREAGVGAYWMADPFEPSVKIIRWDGENEHEQFVAGDDTLTVEWPFALELRPSSLVADER